ncbi:Hypothetical protein AA314_04748 [Archangium gephyra]|uniref:Uncharacterized protein n=1 Tax=Archangium gephyra TaxID=48 RepID=A0AAC8TEM7_9BACT|nr:Hypothetical protein AA314_04748 [Archangium gephyra]
MGTIPQKGFSENNSAPIRIRTGARNPTRIERRAPLGV